MTVLEHRNRRLMAGEVGIAEGVPLVRQRLLDYLAGGEVVLPAGAG
jgi:hypothetical protein